MARIRSIKPEFFVSAQVADVSTTCRLLFIGMWIFCDDAGRHPASCKQLKMEVFPGDDFTSSEVAEWIDELIMADLLVEYDITDGPQAGTYWQVTGWHHQKIERKRVQYPEPNFDDVSTINRRLVGDTSTTRTHTTGPDRTGPETTRSNISSTGVEGAFAKSDSKPKKRKQNTYPQEFELWWVEYPKKTGKLAASKQWKIAAARVGKDKLLEMTRLFAVSDKGRGEYCPDPERWLKRGMYDDDPEAWSNSPAGGNGKARPKVKETIQELAAREAREIRERGR